MTAPSLETPNPNQDGLEERITRALEAIARACEKAQAEYLAEREAREQAKIATHGPFWWHEVNPES